MGTKRQANRLIWKRGGLVLGFGLAMAVVFVTSAGYAIYESLLGATGDYDTTKRQGAPRGHSTN